MKGLTGRHVFCSLVLSSGFVTCSKVTETVNIAANVGNSSHFMTDISLMIIYLSLILNRNFCLPGKVGK